MSVWRWRGRAGLDEKLTVLTWVWVEPSGCCLLAKAFSALSQTWYLSIVGSRVFSAKWILMNADPDCTCEIEKASQHPLPMHSNHLQRVPPQWHSACSVSARLHGCPTLGTVTYSIRPKQKVNFTETDLTSASERGFNVKSLFLPILSQSHFFRLPHVARNYGMRNCTPLPAVLC